MTEDQRHACFRSALRMIDYRVAQNSGRFSVAGKWSSRLMLMTLLILSCTTKLKVAEG